MDRQTLCIQPSAQSVSGLARLRMLRQPVFAFAELRTKHVVVDVLVHNGESFLQEA